MKNLVSIFAGHDSNISFYHAEKDEYHTIEIERLVQKRYFRLHEDNSPEYQKDVLIQCRDIAEKEWGIKNDYEAFLISSDGYIQTDPREIFNTEKVITIASHHQTHAASALHLSPFDKALIVSYDGGGDDGHFNVYMGDKEKGIRLLENIPSDFGGGYLLCGAMVREVSESSRHMLALSGKLMGLCAYGEVIDEYVNAFKEFFFDRNYNKLAKVTGLPLKNVDTPWKDPLQMYVFEDKKGYDIAASAQAGFEYAIFSVLDKYDPDIPLIMTGGCALNVLVNEKVKCLYNRPLYVPPNPHDGSLSLGHLFLYNKPTKQVDITYSGLPLVDRNKLSDYIDEYGAIKVNKKKIAELIKDGKILGLVYGDSEVGPRALGNRSIVCDPNIADMKDILNSKVKFREWYRPFAPFCKKEEAHQWFETRDFDNFEYMSYAPTVKVDTLPSITHVDGTARLQVVTEDSHSHFYELLTEFGKLSETNVLLNTSFNIRGYPILSSIEDALYALNNTEMDYVVIEDYLFGKLK
jgi:carbamoyltransferase